MNTPNVLRPMRKIATAALIAVAAVTCMSASGTSSAAGAHHGKSALVQATKEWKKPSPNEVVLATKEWKRPATTTLEQ